MSKSLDRGDKLCLDILNAISSTDIKAIKYGNVIATHIDTSSFNTIYYSKQTTSATSLQSSIVKLVDQNYNLRFINTIDDRLTDAFLLELTNNRCSLNQSNNYMNQIVAIAFTIKITIPKEIYELGYEEDYVLRFIVVRDSLQSSQFGPKISDILNLKNSSGQPVEKSLFITAQGNVNSTNRYQILYNNVVYMNTLAYSKVLEMNLSFSNNATLIYPNNSLGADVKPVMGNIYIGVIKESISKRLTTPENLSDDEIRSLYKRVVEFDLDENTPEVSVKSRLILE